jgi:hypothetical protein
MMVASGTMSPIEARQIVNEDVQTPSPDQDTNNSFDSGFDDSSNSDSYDECTDESSCSQDEVEFFSILEKVLDSKSGRVALACR